MPITVIITRDDVGAPSTSEVYETGVKYIVEGGDLMIYSDRPQLLGTYGSGNWLSVFIGDNVTVISKKPEEDSDSDSGFGDFGSDFGSDDDTSFGSDDTSLEDTSLDDTSSDETSSLDDTSSDDASSLEDTSLDVSSDETSSLDDISLDDTSSDDDTSSEESISLEAESESTDATV
jgi:hypothetical protein